MKNVVLFIALIMLTKPLWPVLDYATNYDFIVSTLCENKDKPELECNGKCYLSKQLAKEAGNDEDNPYNNPSKIEIPQFIISEQIPEYNFSIELQAQEANDFSFKENLYYSQYVLQILHPPQLG